MTTSVRSKLLSACVAVVVFAQAGFGKETPPITAAILDFHTSDAKLGSKGAEIAQLLSAQLSGASNIILVERQELTKALGEQELGLSGTVSPETVAQVGKLTGAKVLVTGRVIAIGAKYSLIAKIMSTETSRVFGETVSFADMATIDEAVTQLAGKIESVISAHTDALIAKVENPQERLDRLRKIVAGKKLPSIAVTITEQHISRPVIDPAAQTEMLKTLQELGFEIVDARAPAKQPDVTIVGEAFSEAAGHTGNLVSCRSRIETKVIERSSGKLLLADRQTDVAVDLAENVAGKTALQNAALKLLDRIIPKLVSG